jgi:protein transport protein SEC24
MGVPPRPLVALLKQVQSDQAASCELLYMCQQAANVIQHAPSLGVNWCVRATRGLRISNFYGNYFIRGTDLLALPNCTSDSTFGLDIQYDEAVLAASAITVQAALLYTSAAGERRIRVHTMLIPVTTNVNEMVASADIDACVNIMSKQAVEIAQKTGLDSARSRVHQAAVDCIRASKGLGGGGAGAGGPMVAGAYHHHGMAPGGQHYGMPQQPAAAAAAADAPLPVSLQLLPLYAMAIQKSLVLRGGTEMRVDERAFYQQLVSNMSVDESKVFIYPRMFSIHDFDHLWKIYSDLS